MIKKNVTASGQPLSDTKMPTHDIPSSEWFISRPSAIAAAPASLMLLNPSLGLHPTEVKLHREDNDGSYVVWYHIVVIELLSESAAAIEAAPSGPISFWPILW